MNFFRALSDCPAPSLALRRSRGIPGRQPEPDEVGQLAKLGEIPARTGADVRDRTAPLARLRARRLVPHPYDEELIAHGAPTLTDRRSPTSSREVLRSGRAPRLPAPGRPVLLPRSKIATTAPTDFLSLVKPAALPRRWLTRRAQSGEFGYANFKSRGGWWSFAYFLRALRGAVRAARTSRRPNGECRRLRDE